MKYKISWLEIINIEFICEEMSINPYETDSEQYPKNYKKVLDRILEDLPPNSKHSGELFGDWEFECQDEFDAKDLKEARKIVNDYDCEIFTVEDENGFKYIEEDF